MPAVALAALLSAELSIHFGMGPARSIRPARTSTSSLRGLPTGRPRHLSGVAGRVRDVFGASTLVFASMANSSEPVAASVRLRRAARPVPYAASHEAGLPGRRTALLL